MEFPDRTGLAGGLPGNPRQKASVRSGTDRSPLDNPVCGRSARLGHQGHPSMGRTPDPLGSSGLSEVVA